MNRELIDKGLQMLGMERDEIIAETIKGCKRWLKRSALKDRLFVLLGIAFMAFGGASNPRDSGCFYFPQG